ncbi:hypothetical protein D3C75_1129380 [compost metagenome]
MLADTRAIEDDRVDTDQAEVAHRAAMQHGVVANGHALAQGQRRAHVGVHHRAILHVAALANVDQLVVPAQHRAKPHAGIGLQAHIADQRGVGCGPTGGVALDPQVAQAVFHACSSGWNADGGVGPAQFSM